MGIDKRNREEVEARWDYKAQTESIRCLICSQQIIYDEREIYYETKMCGYCAHTAQKDD